MNARRMLVIDADPVLSRVLTRSFRQRNFDAASVRDAETAIEFAESNPLDFVILEKDVPGASGAELIRTLRTLNPRAKLLVLTSRPSVESAIHCIKLGACNYLAKPAHVEELLQGFGIDPLAVAASLKHPRPRKAHSLDEFEWKHIRRVLVEHEGNVSAAARELRMNRRTLQRKLEAYEAKTGKDIATQIRAGSDRRRRIMLRRKFVESRKSGVNADAPQPG